MTNENVTRSAPTPRAAMAPEVQRIQEHFDAIIGAYLYDHAHEVWSAVLGAACHALETSEKEPRRALLARLKAVKVDALEAREALKAPPERTKL